MTSSPKAINGAPKKSNLNEHWKNLDAIFQTQLRKYVESENKDKFNSLAKELGFNDIQKQFLFDSIQTFIKQFTSRPTLNPFRPFKPISIMTSPNNTNNSNNSLYAIPSNKNENVSGSKRKRDDIISDNFDESDSMTNDDDDNNNNDNNMISPKRKKRRKVKKRRNSRKPDQNIENKEVEDVENKLWKKDKHLTPREQKELEEKGVYVIDRIVNHRKISDYEYKYNVLWEGYRDKTWEPTENIHPFIIELYWKEKGYTVHPNGAVIHLNDIKKTTKTCTTKKKKIMTKTVEKKNKNERKKKRGKYIERNKKDERVKCPECDQWFKNRMALGGHSGKHRKKRNKKETKKENKRDIVPYWEDSEDERELIVIDD